MHGPTVSLTHKRWRLLGLAVGLVAALASATLFAAKSPRTPTDGATPAVVAAVEAPATLVPLTLRAPTPEGDELLGKRMMDFGLALDRASKDPSSARDLSTIEAGLTGSELRDVLGPNAAASLRALVEVAKQSANAPPLDHASVDALDVAVARLDSELLAEGRPYFVDATVMTDMRGRGDRPRRIIVFTEFSILESNLYASNEGVLVRSVRVRRLDRLSFRHASLGFVNPRRAQATVLLDVVDEEVVRHLLPALADDAPMPLVLPERSAPPTRSRVSPPLAEIAARAGEQARLELGALPGVDREALENLGAALRARRELLEKYNSRLHVLGVELRIPTGLTLDLASLEHDLGDNLDARDQAALREIQARVASAASAKAFASVRDALADSIERHEVQHRLDLEHATRHGPLAMPAPVSASIRGEGPRAEEFRDAIKNELSGYVAELARDARMPKTMLALLLRFLMNPRTRTSTEAHVARITAEELCRVLGIRDVAPLVHDGLLDEERLARAHRELTQVSPSELAGAAATAWRNLFGRPLPELERGS
jgi:hypothetical protein